MNYIIDTYAWVEYLIGSQKGEKVRELMNNSRNKFITLDCCLAELKGWALRHQHNFDSIMNIIKSNSHIFPIMLEHWLKAAEIKHEQMKKQRNFGLIDAIIIAKQQDIKCSILTGDQHFKELKAVEII